MYLKKVVMQGFKSFADKTEVNFEDNITAVVGPNGSGKSNVSDAVKWVLGEQSAKSLRGGKMEDIIFSGTDKRGPLGFAEVTVIFSNNNRKIPIDYSEVAVTRRMFRSGDSEFYINKNSCRLRDIRELFMDTGIGKDGYSIIGQGKVDQILSDRPEDRRHIFEEAAGIVKYRSKKEETERKLKRTDENLIRINDLISEIARQNNSLERDAEKAKEYLEIYEDLKKLELNLYVKDIGDLNKSLRQLEKESSQLKSKLDSSQRVKEQKEEKLAKFNLEFENVVSSIKALEEKKYKLDGQSIEARNNLRILEEKEVFMKREKTRLEKEIADNKSEIISSTNLLEEKRGEKSKLKEDIDNLYKALEEKEKSFTNLIKLVKAKEDEIEARKEKLVNTYNESSDFKSKLNSIDSFEENISKRISQLTYNLKGYKDQKQAGQGKLDIYQEKENQLREKYQSLLETRDKYMTYSVKLGEESQKLQESIQSLRVDLEGYKSNYRLYQNMENEYDGYYRSVKNLLLALDNKKVDSQGVLGVVADLIEVKSDYEKAIDVTLGSSVQNIVTRDENSARDMIKYLRVNNLGRASFLPLSKFMGNSYNLNPTYLKEEGVLGLAKDFVDYDSEYKGLMEYLLGRTIIVDNIDNAIKFSKEKKVRQRIVTLDGDIINPSGAMTGGSFSKNVFSIISRKNKIQELKERIEKGESNLKSLLRKQEDSKNRDDKDRKYFEDLDSDIRQVNLELIELVNGIKNIKSDLSRLDLDIEEGQGEINSLEEERVGFTSKRENYKVKIQEYNEKSQLIKTVLDEGLDLLNKLKEDHESLHGDLTELRIKINDFKNNLANLEQEDKSILENLNKSNNHINNNLEEINQIEDEFQKNSENRKSIEIAIKEKDKEKSLLEKKLTQENEKKKSKEDAIKEISKEISSLGDGLIDLEREKNKLSLNESKLEMKLENLEESLYEDYNYSYRDILNFEDRSLDLVKTRGKVKEIKKQIKKLGNINLDSLREYEEVNKRYLFLKGQAEDLVTSKENLEKVIKDIEKEMKHKFLESLEKIDENFSKIFKTLFNGGRASIKIEDRENVLESGIEIEAEPPGKRLQNIRLLSGGEKSMTAVALLFAILEMKPSPFCILDEIDAALDDANIGRYTDYLKSLNEDTQFILITHRKPTMEISNVLYGVTMLEEGVSELYSVKMKDFKID